MADRYLYLPMTGVALMLASLLAGLLSSRRRIGMACGVAVIASFALARVTLARERAWHDAVALWSDTALRNPHSFDAADDLGFALVRAGRLQSAAESFERAIAISSGKSADPFAGLAITLDALGRHEEAVRAFHRAVENSPRYAHPDLLVKSLSWESADAERLRKIAEEN